MNLMAIVEFFKVHWLDIGSAITSIIGIASIIVKITPNKNDDVILANILAFLGKYIALNPVVKK